METCENGGLCTNNCDKRSTCQLSRVKLLIPCVVVDATPLEKKKMDDIPPVYAQDYTNSLVLLKQELMDAEPKQNYVAGQADIGAL